MVCNINFFVVIGGQKQNLLLKLRIVNIAVLDTFEFKIRVCSHLPFRSSMTATMKLHGKVWVEDLGWDVVMENLGGVYIKESVSKFLDWGQVHVWMKCFQMDSNSPGTRNISVFCTLMDVLFCWFLITAPLTFFFSFLFDEDSPLNN